MVNFAFLAKHAPQKEQPQILFDYAQGRLSTSFAAKSAVIFAHDDCLLV
jgi:hypothetical protein